MVVGVLCVEEPLPGCWGRGRMPFIYRADVELDMGCVEPDESTPSRMILGRFGSGEPP